jgi:hypothetical protein
LVRRFEGKVDMLDVKVIAMVTDPDLRQKQIEESVASTGIPAEEAENQLKEMATECWVMKEIMKEYRREVALHRNPQIVQEYFRPIDPLSDYRNYRSLGFNDNIYFAIFYVKIIICHREKLRELKEKGCLD